MDHIFPDKVFIDEFYGAPGNFVLLGSPNKDKEVVLKKRDLHRIRDYVVHINVKSQQLNQQNILLYLIVIFIYVTQESTLRKKFDRAKFQFINFILISTQASKNCIGPSARAKITVSKLEDKSPERYGVGRHLSPSELSNWPAGSITRTNIEVASTSRATTS